MDNNLWDKLVNVVAVNVKNAISVKISICAANANVLIGNVVKLLQLDGFLKYF
jgi:ribosomal protein S8